MENPITLTQRRNQGNKRRDQNNKSHDQATESRIQAIYTTLHNVPQGKVIGYGRLAAYAGLPGYGRYVGRVLRNLPQSTSLPWHRVVRATGQIAFPCGSDAFTRQQNLLEKEGIVVVNGRISMKRFQWKL